MKLQSSAKALPFPVILSVIEQEYNRRWNKVFQYIDEEALGSASIAQVHRAVLASGEKVVVKVQRPGIYEIMSKDIALLKRAAALLKVVSRSQDVVDFNMVLDEMWTIAKQEMDFLLEADHIDEFNHLNRDVDYVTCPQVYRQLSTPHILVMEFIDGIRIDDFDKLSSRGYDINLLGRHLGENYVKQIIEDGFFMRIRIPAIFGFATDGLSGWILGWSASCQGVTGWRYAKRSTHWPIMIPLK